jgi:hypothetical protein
MHQSIKPTFGRFRHLLRERWGMVVDCVDDLLIALRGDATAHPQEIIDCELAGIGEVGKPFFQEVVFCSCPRSAVATNVLVTLAIRNGGSKRGGARIRRSATPTTKPYRPRSGMAARTATLGKFACFSKIDARKMNRVA